VETCLKFAQLMARNRGMNYADAVKKYPRGPYKNSVYKNAWETHQAHCIHCARAEILGGNGDLKW